MKYSDLVAIPALAKYCEYIINACVVDGRRKREYACLHERPECLADRLAFFQQTTEMASVVDPVV